MLVLAGLALIVWAFLVPPRDAPGPRPAQADARADPGGPYRWSRNPMYLGMALIQAGVGIALGNAWILLLLVPTLWINQRYVIESEEAYLADSSARPYAAYRSAVRAGSRASSAPSGQPPLASELVHLELSPRARRGRWPRRGAPSSGRCARARRAR